MFLEKIYASIPYVLLPLSIVVMLALFLFGRITLLLNSLLILIPCIIGSIYLIVMRKKNENMTIIYLKKDQLLIPQRTLRRLFLIVAIAIFLLLLLNDYTSPLFLILIAILYALCLLQIISKDTSTTFVLFGIIYTTAMFIMPLFLTPAYYYDGSDIISHTKSIISIINSGVVPSADTIGIYGLFPGMHLFVGCAGSLSGLIAQTSLCLYLPLAYFGGSLFVYLLSKQLFSSSKIGMLATYFYLLIGILYSDLTSLAPFNFLSLISIIIIYLVLRKLNTNKLRFYIIAAPIIAISIISHHANHIPISLILLVLLALDLFIVLEGKINKEARQHIINIPVIIMYFSAIAVYLYYTYITSTIQYLSGALRTDDEFSISSLTTIVESYFADFILQYVRSFYLVIIIFAILIALYYIITSKKRTQKQYLFALFILIFFVIFIPGVSQTLPIVSGLMLDRWRGILLLFFAIAMASGLVIFIQNVSRTKKYQKTLVTSIVLIIGLILLIYPVITISADNALLSYAGIDNVHSEPLNAANNHFTSKDLAMFSLFSESLSPTNNVASDLRSTRYISTYILPGSDRLLYDDIFNYDINKTNEIQKYDIILFRKDHFEYCGSFIYRGNWNDADQSIIKIEPNADTKSAINRNTRSHHIIYNNGGDVAYHN